MNILYIISSSSQHKAALLGLADWELLRFNRILQFDTLRQVPPARKNLDPLLVLLDSKEISKKDAERILELKKNNSIFEIILFSDTKDYETLSRALSLHVSALISWENFRQEIFEDTLKDVMNSITTQVHETGIIKRQLLRDIIKGKKPTADEIYRYFDIDDAYASYIAFYIRRDEPVSILFGHEASTDYYAVNWRGNLFHPDFDYIATVNLYMHSWCTLIRVRRMPSDLNLFNLCWQTAAMLQQSFAAQMNDTVSVAFSDIFQNFDDFTRRVDTLQQILDQQNYGGRSRIASFRDPMPVFIDAREFMNIWRPRFSQALYEGNADAACGITERLFTQLRQSQYSRSACLESVCRDLVDEIDNYCRNYSIPTVRETSLNMSSRPVCYSLQDVTAVFQSAVRRVISSVEKGSAAIDNDKINEIIKYIENNCEISSVSMVAAHFHMSVDYLSHFFKNKTGRNLSAVITEKKVNLSKSLLLQGKYRIKDVAAMVGFNSSQYFSTVFMKIEGMSPHQFIESQNRKP